MDREQLAARHTDVIRRHSRALADTGGQPGTALLDELAAIADEHRGEPERNGLSTTITSLNGGDPIEAIAAKVATARKPAARRTTTRRSTK